MFCWRFVLSFCHLNFLLKQGLRFSLLTISDLFFLVVPADKAANISYFETIVHQKCVKQIRDYKNVYTCYNSPAHEGHILVSVRIQKETSTQMCTPFLIGLN